MSRKGTAFPYILIILVVFCAGSLLLFKQSPTTPDPPHPNRIVSPAATSAAASPTTPTLPIPAKQVSHEEPPSQTAWRKLIDEGHWIEARTELAKAMIPAQGTERDDVLKRMLEVNRVLMFEKPAPDIERHTVLSGESYGVLQQKTGVPYGLIKMLNHAKSDILRAGDKIRLPRGRFSLVIRKFTFRLYLFYEGAAFNEFPIAIGTDQKTPAALFKIGKGMTLKPNWYPTPGLSKRPTVPYGDPENPLGEAWIPFEHEEYTNLGIHGTNQPDTIGSKASNGCIRMRNEDVFEIFRAVKPGMEVVILE